MWKHPAVSAVIAMSIAISPSAAPARVIEDWPYKKLFKESDLVVFVTPVRTDPANDKPPEHFWPYEFVGQNTTFNVQYALKGKAEGDQIKVLHFKFGKLKTTVDKDNFLARIIHNGPSFVSFPTEEPAVVKTGENASRPLPAEYLLFLKKLKDNRYTPVSGYIDPDLAVREVSAARSE